MQEFRWQHLERDRAFKRGIVRLVDGGHAPFAEETGDPERAERGAGWQRGIERIVQRFEC